MGIWDRIKGAVGSLWRKGAAAVGSLRRNIGRARDTAKGWVQPWAAGGTGSAYASAVRAMNSAQTAVSQQWRNAQIDFERAQAAQNIRDQAARRRLRTLRTRAVNVATRRGAEAIRKGQELQKLINQKNELVQRKSRERRARLETDISRLRAVPREARTVADHMHRAALDVLTGASTKMNSDGFEANRLIEAAIPDDLERFIKSETAAFLVMPGGAVKVTTSRAGVRAAGMIGSVLRGAKPDKLIELYRTDPTNVIRMVSKLKPADQQTIYKALMKIPIVEKTVKAITTAEVLAARRIGEVIHTDRTARFIDFWKTDKKAVIKVFKGMSTEAQENFLKSLRGSPLAWKIMAELQAKALWAGASLPAKAALAAVALGTVAKPFSMAIFTATEIPQQFLMGILARKTLEQERGKYAPALSFQLRSYEKNITNLRMGIKRAIDRGDPDTAAKLLIELRHALDEYIAFREKKRDVMFPEDYDNLTSLVNATEIDIGTFGKQIRGEAPTWAQARLNLKQKEAQIWLNSRREAYKPNKRYTLGGGRKYTYVASAPGYKRKSGSFWLDEWDTKDVDIDLEAGEELMGKVITRSSPEAEVWMGGIDTGFTTPHTFELPPGTYDFRFEAKGHKPKTKSATVWAGEERTLDVILEEEWTERELTTGYLSIDTAPMGAYVSLNDIVQDYPTPTKVDLKPGQYVIKIRKSGYMPIQDSVTIEAGQTYKKMYDLEEGEEEDVWRVHVSSDPAGGKILIDDFFTGAWTPGFVDLLAGTYVVGVQKTGFVPAEEVIEAG